MIDFSFSARTGLSFYIDFLEKEWARREQQDDANKQLMIRQQEYLHNWSDFCY
jgi:hypothetical protein